MRQRHMMQIATPTSWLSRSTDGTLIGIDLATGEIVFVHDPFAEYPYIGSAYVHNPSISGCSTHEKYWRKVVYGTPCS